MLPIGDVLNLTHKSAHEWTDKQYRRSEWRKKVISSSNHPFIYLFIERIKIKKKLRFEDLTVVTIKNAVCWVLMPFILV
jgi:hypothetical protein